MLTRTQTSQHKYRRNKSLPANIRGISMQNQYGIFNNSSRTAKQQKEQAINSTTINYFKNNSQDFKNKPILDCLNAFEQFLSTLPYLKEDQAILKKSLKELNSIVSLFPSFSAIKPDQAQHFLNKWDNLKTQSRKKLESAYQLNTPVFTYEDIFNKIESAKKHLQELKSKRTAKQQQTLKKIFDGFETVEAKILNLNDPETPIENENELISELLNDLSKLQSIIPITTSSQEIAESISQLKTLQTNKQFHSKFEKHNQTLNNRINKTDTQLNTILTKLSSDNSNKSQKGSPSVSSKSKRSKSVSAFDSKSVVSRFSHFTTATSATSRSSINMDQKIIQAKSQLAGLKRNVDSLKKSIKQSEDTNDQLNAQKVQNRKDYASKIEHYIDLITDILDKGGSYEAGLFEEQETQLIQLLKQNRQLKKTIKMVNSTEYKNLVFELNYINFKINQLTQTKDLIEEDLKRAKNVSNVLQKNISNPDEDKTIQFNDNIEFTKEIKRANSQVDSVMKSIHAHTRTLYDSYQALDRNEDVNSEEVQLMYDRLEFDESFLKKWMDHLNLEIEKIEQTNDQISNEISKLTKSQKFETENEVFEHNLENLKEAYIKYRQYQFPENPSSVSVEQKIKLNKLKIETLSNTRNIPKLKADDPRNQDRQMLNWTEELIAQVQDELKSQKERQIQFKSRNLNLIKAKDNLKRANYERNKNKVECQDTNVLMQNLYDVMFQQKPPEQFIEIFPEVTERIQKLVEYKNLKAQLDSLKPKTDNTNSMKLSQENPADLEQQLQDSGTNLPNDFKDDVDNEEEIEVQNDNEDDIQSQDNQHASDIDDDEPLSLEEEESESSVINNNNNDLNELDDVHSEDANNFDEIKQINPAYIRRNKSLGANTKIGYFDEL